MSINITTNSSAVDGSGHDGTHWGKLYRQKLEELTELGMFLNISDAEQHQFGLVAKTNLEMRLKSEGVTKQCINGIRGIAKNPTPHGSTKYRDAHALMLDTLRSASPTRLTNTLMQATANGGRVGGGKLAEIMQISIERAAGIIRYLRKCGILRRCKPSSALETPQYVYTGKPFQIPPSDQLRRFHVFQMGNQIMNQGSLLHCQDFHFSAEERASFLQHMAGDDLLMDFQGFHDPGGQTNHGVFAVVAPWRQGDPPAMAVSDALRNYEMPGHSIMRVATASVADTHVPHMDGVVIRRIREKLATMAQLSQSQDSAERGRHLIALTHGRIEL